MSDLAATHPIEHPTSRRRFLKRGLLGAAGTLAAGLSYAVLETTLLQIQRETIVIPRLPEAFRGTRIAFLADSHIGQDNSLDYLQQVVGDVNGLQPDLILLGGDYVHIERKYIAPTLATLGQLHAPRGVFGVLGNHDYWSDGDLTKQEMANNGIVELSNTGVWLEEQGQRLRLGGVDDLWEGQQFLSAALADTQKPETSILLSHNPDYVENLIDPRVGLVLSGHTHGGQVVLPIVGAPQVPSSYGQKYLSGLVKTEHTQVYVTRGVGSTGVLGLPVRFCCRPEISLIEIV